MESLNLSIGTLVPRVLLKMSELDYSETTITNYRRFYNRLLKFAEESGAEFYSEQLGSEFLKKYYGSSFDTIRENAPTKKIRMQARYIRVLGDYQLHGFILRRKLGPLAIKEVPGDFQKAFDSYWAESLDRGLSEQGIYSRRNRIKHFLFYLQEHSADEFDKITPALLSGYVNVCAALSDKSIAANLTSIRCFLRYLHLNTYTSSDLSEVMPKLKNYYAPKVPNLWKPEEVRIILESIDRGNATGKRDYAILLMISRLGLRASDIKALRLDNIHWDIGTIEIIQHKTKNPASYPILRDIGWALIDYLKSGRPKTDSPFIFVRHNAPFEAFAPNAAMNRILVKYIREAGVKIPRQVSLGMHSLRHTLASTLLAENVPIHVISEVLGHANLKSTDIYLHIDFQRLKECALNPEEVF